jgi:hypothetical protein
MRLSKLAAYLIIILLIQTCYSTEPDNGDPTPPPGYQEDIPWPSLADSPWPMNRGNPQCTGRSKYPGPSLGVLKWNFSEVLLRASIVIGEDSTIYFNTNEGLYAVTPQGNLKWKFSFEITYYDASTTPMIGADGTIYIIYHFDRSLYAINDDGSLKWKLILGIYDGVELEGMNIGLDGTIYLIGRDYKLYAVSNEGSIKWSFSNGDFRGLDNSSISFSPDGKVLYLPGRTKTIYAFEIDSKNILWSFGNSEGQQAPLVDNAGNIYLQSQSAEYNHDKPSFYSLNPDGTVRWSFLHNDRFMLGPFSEPTMDRYGNTYFAKDTVYSFNYSGNLRWKYSLEGGRTGTPMVCDDNNILFVNYVINNQYISSFAINSDKKLIWESIDLMKGTPGESPALGFNMMYIPTGESGDVFSIE